MLKPSEISDLARELRGAGAVIAESQNQESCAEEDLMILESICLQLSQQKTVDQ